MPCDSRLLACCNSLYMNSLMCACVNRHRFGWHSGENLNLHCSNDKVAEFWQKFGRPSVSGRKRKVPAGDDVHVETSLIKTTRGKVFSVMLNIT